MTPYASVKVIHVRRISKGGKYYDRITYEKDGEKRTSTRLWKPKQGNKQEREKKYERALQVSHRDAEVKDYVKRVKGQVRKRSVKQVKKRGFYYSTIKMHVVVRYKNTTPFFFPAKSNSNFLGRAANATEKQLLANILNLAGQDAEFRYWMSRFKPGGDIYIYGGWTYRRTFSTEGNFNGDSEYLDFVERRFDGNKAMRSINRFREVQRKEPQPIDPAKIRKLRGGKSRK